MRAVIMAGGKGTRIASVANDVPKPMIQICGKPILQYQIECLRRQNIIDIILVVGHLGEVIKEYFGDGSAFKVNISYIEEEEPLGTAGALYYLKDIMQEDFLLINGDIIFDVNFERFMDYHKMKGGYATIFTHPNNHPYDSGLIVTDQQGMVTQWMHKEDERSIYKNRVNAGIHILSEKVLEMFEEVKKTDLDRDILKHLIPQKRLAAYDSPEYVRDMGTPERYQMVTRDIKSGLVEAKNLKNRQKAVFLDRDGTINLYKGFIRSHQEMELILGVADQIRKINESGYLAIVVTNQPVIARGECTIEELERIHEKMETLLGQEGAYIDDLFYCPHHPDKGFEGERIEYKVECECRKPKPGMLVQAAEKYNIDLSESYMVGDDERDIEAGRLAGCKVVKTEKNVAFNFEMIGVGGGGVECPICNGNAEIYTAMECGEKRFLYYVCEHCGSIFIAPDIIEEMDAGKTLIEYTKEYWNMEFQAAKERCFGVCLARLAEVIHYATVPINNFLDIGGGTGLLLDAISLYLPDHISHFHSVEKYPSEDGYRTANKNFHTCSYSELEMQFQAGICMEVIEHLTPKMLVDMFRDIATVSSDGAIYLINTGMPKYVREQNPSYLDPFVRGHIVSYSIEGIRILLEPLGYRVFSIRGKDWAFCIEYHSNKNDEDITGRIWKALPENLALLQDSKMGKILQILGRESVNAYLIY